MKIPKWKKLLHVMSEDRHDFYVRTGKKMDIKKHPFWKPYQKALKDEFKKYRRFYK